MKLEEIIKLDGQYVAEGFKKGFCFEVKNGYLFFVTYQSEMDTAPEKNRGHIWADLFDKEYTPILSKSQLFSAEITMAEIVKEFDKIYNLAIDLVKSEAKKELRRNNDLGEFVMGMGTYFFKDKYGNILHEYKCEGVDSIINEWDILLKLTGEPMRFTVDGPIVVDW